MAAAFLLIAGCGLPRPTERDFDVVRRLPPPPGPYARVKAVADLESEHLSGTFDVLVLARSGARPLVRLQLLPDLGGKALDLLVSPDRLQGRFPATGESVDWALPDEARAHPLLFIGLTLLERFAPITEDRLTGAAPGEFELDPVVEGTSVRYAGGEHHLGWGAWARWTAGRKGVRAKGFQLQLRDVTIEPLASIDEALLRFK